MRKPSTSRRHRRTPAKPKLGFVKKPTRRAAGVEVPERLTGQELLALPSEVRRRRLAKQARSAAKYYRIDPDLDFRADDPILEY